MRSAILGLLCLALSAALPAAPDPAPAANAQPTVKPTLMSTPDVQVDPLFTIAPFADKWPHISLEEAKRLQKKRNVVFVDGRARIEWEQSHIPGAIPMPLGEFDKAYAADLKAIKKASILVSYCHGEGCRLSDMLAEKLVGKGHKNVAVFWGGFPAWSGAGLPLQDKNGKSVVNSAAQQHR